MGKKGDLGILCLNYTGNYYFIYIFFNLFGYFFLKGKWKVGEMGNLTGKRVFLKQKVTRLSLP